MTTNTPAPMRASLAEREINGEKLCQPCTSLLPRFRETQATGKYEDTNILARQISEQSKPCKCPDVRLCVL